MRSLVKKAKSLQVTRVGRGSSESHGSEAGASDGRVPALQGGYGGGAEEKRRGEGNTMVGGARGWKGGGGGAEEAGR